MPLGLIEFSFIVFGFGLVITGIVALGIFQEREHEAANRRRAAAAKELENPASSPPVNRLKIAGPWLRDNTAA